jgi:hypothetical protein
MIFWNVANNQTVYGWEKYMISISEIQIDWNVNSGNMWWVYKYLEK